MKGFIKWAKGLNSEIFVLYYASKDPRVLWQVKAFMALLVVYLLSPVDLISDFIPILGYLDDLIIVPLGVSSVLRLIPGPIVCDARERANKLGRNVKSWAGIAIVVTLGLLFTVVVYRFVSR